jgi:solute carrier family 25 oxoglutarate transporter 11
MASATAATSASLTSLPFDMIKTRIQNMKPDPATGAMPYGGVLDCGAKIARAEGVLAFWRGLSAYYARTAPHAMIVLVTMDALNTAWKKHLL